MMVFLQGMVFDLEKGSTLYVDLAKSNSRSKRSRIGNDLFIIPEACCSTVFVNCCRPELCKLLDQMMENLDPRRELKGLLHFQVAFLILVRWMP